MDPSTTYWAVVLRNSGGYGTVGRSTSGFLLDDTWLSIGDDRFSKYSSFMDMTSGNSGQIMTMQITAVPEPSSVVLVFSLVVGGAVLLRRRRKS